MGAAEDVVRRLRAGETVTIAKPTVPDVLPLLDAYYAIPCFGMGGITHLWMEDPNYGQETAEWELAYALEPSGKYDMHNDYDVFMAWVATQISLTQRAKCSKLHDYPKEGAGAAPFWTAADAFARKCTFTNAEDAVGESA